MASQPIMDMAAAAATSDDNTPTLLLNGVVVWGLLLLGGSLGGVSFPVVLESWLSSAPVDDEFCACSEDDYER